MTTSKTKLKKATLKKSTKKNIKNSKKKSANKKIKKTAKKMKAIEMENWPEKRDLFYKPERLSYVRKGPNSEACVFCTSENSKIEFESLCVYKSTHAMVILNKYPYNTGHLLVLPRRHCGSLLDLSDQEYLDLQNVLRNTVEAIYSIYKPNAVNLGMNHGKASGAGIPEHLHYHVIPRWNGDTNFFPLIAQTKVLVETLDQTYQRVRGFFLKKS
ncbi:MAG TPA: HIT domain-containing protein [Pseudobdellovibrionaceae bacterium]|nr:HIT domain-containing protein [Pseudobdellovibrionaceae bacterium]